MILQNVTEKHNFSVQTSGHCKMYCETTLRQVFQKVYSAKMLHFTKKKTPTDCVDNTLGLVLPVCTCAAQASPLPLIQLVQSLGPKICQCWTNYFLMVTHHNLGYATTNLMQDIWSCRSPRRGLMVTKNHRRQSDGQTHAVLHMVQP